MIKPALQDELELHLFYRYESDEQFLKTMQRKIKYFTLSWWSYTSHNRNAHFALHSKYAIEQMRKYGRLGRM